MFPAVARATVDVVIRGEVHGDLEEPLAGATVVLHDPRGAAVAKMVTGPDGAFLFHGIPFGDYTVEATLPGRLEDHRHLQVTSSETASVVLYCVSQQNVSVVVEESEVPAPSRATGSVATLDRQSVARLPKGDDRPITEVVTTQPGFVLDAFGNVYARGNHANLQYQIDGIPIPDSVGNLFAQALPVRLVEKLELLTGGLPAEFGDRLAAVVNIVSRRAGATPDGYASIRYGSFQTVEPAVAYSRTFGPVGVFVGGSYVQSERALDPPSVTPILHDDGRSGRGFARIDWAVRDRDRLELFASYAYNFFQIPIDPSVVPLDPSQPSLVRPSDQYGNASPPFVPHDTDATETEHELFVAASWVHTFLHRGTLQIAPYYKFSYGALAADATHALGVLADPGSTTSDVTRRADHGGAVASYSVALGHHLVKAGAQLDYLAGATDFTEYARAGGGVVDAAQTSRGSDHTGALLTGAYVQDHWERGRLALNYGLRFDELHVLVSGGGSDDQFGVSPRLGASFAIHKNWIAHAFVGVSWQPPAPLDAANAARVLGVIPAGTLVPYDVKAETDVYGEAGLDARPWKRLRLGVVGWGRYAWNQLDDTAIGATNLIANYNFERGRAVGVEGKLELQLGYWLTAFANISWEIAQGQGIASAKYLFAPDQLADQSWQTLDHAQTLTANVGASVKEGGFTLTGLLAYGSGLRTGPSNNATVPQHARVDLTAAYAFERLPLRPTVALDVINLFDSHYAYRIANGFVGSAYAAPRSIFVRLSVPLARGGAQ